MVTTGRDDRGGRHTDGQVGLEVAAVSVPVDRGGLAGVIWP